MSSTSDVEIYFVTGNKNKLEEVQAILGNEFKLISKNIELPEIQGEPSDIAIEKCKLAAKQVGGPVLTEDTSLCFNALKGLPGPYIKWFLTKLGADGLYKMLGAYEDKSAYALCTVGFCWSPNEEPIVFAGQSDGEIVPPRGPTQFGWTPVFQPLGFTETYAEMEIDVKNAISHRRKALDKLRDYLILNLDRLKQENAKN